MCLCVPDDVEAPGQSSGDPAASAHHQGVLAPLLAHGAARQPAHPAAAGARANAGRLLQLPAAPAAASAGPALRTEPDLLPAVSLQPAPSADALAAGAAQTPALLAAGPGAATGSRRAARPSAPEHVPVAYPQTPAQDLQKRVGSPVGPP